MGEGDVVVATHDNGTVGGKVDKSVSVQLDQIDTDISYIGENAV